MLGLVIVSLFKFKVIWPPDVTGVPSLVHAVVARGLAEHLHLSTISGDPVENCGPEGLLVNLMEGHKPKDNKKDTI